MLLKEPPEDLDSGCCRLDLDFSGLDLAPYAFLCSYLLSTAGLVPDFTAVPPMDSPKSILYLLPKNIYVLQGEELDWF